jgi:hypothetical protein
VAFSFEFNLIRGHTGNFFSKDVFAGSIKVYIISQFPGNQVHLHMQFLAPVQLHVNAPNLICTLAFLFKILEEQNLT